MSSDVLPDTPWLHRWAVLTACATVGLLLLGANVTTLDVGMADKEWPTHPLHLLVTSRQQLARMGGLGYIIEHSHRLAGYVVGCCVIVLCVWLWLVEPRRWLRWLGTAALLGVSLQGVLGGLRVLKHAQFGTALAMIHGMFAQLVFALLVSIALWTSHGWRAGPPAPSSDRLRRLTLLVGVLSFLQIVLGSFVRHTSLRLAQRGHFLVAFAVVATAVWLLLVVWQTGDRRLKQMAGVLGVLLAFQLILGVESWMLRFGNDTLTELRRVAAGGMVRLPEAPRVTIASGMVRTLHFVLGSLVFATTVVLALLSRRAAPAPAYRALPAGPLEGAA